MSARVEVKALRVPCDIVGITDAWQFCEDHSNEEEFDMGTYPDFKFPYFHPGLVAERTYLDYVLSERPVGDRMYFTRSRSLTPSEKKTYLPVFKRYFPDLDPNAVRYVHYLYYDGADAPDAYDNDGLNSYGDPERRR